MNARFPIWAGVVTAAFSLSLIFLTTADEWNIWFAGATSGVLFGMGIAALVKVKEGEDE